MAEIEIRALRKAFDGAEVLKGVDLTIHDGEFISLVGPSGCGKSTLLRIIAGLEPQSSGEVRIDGVNADGVRPSARNLAMVFQSYALYPHLSVFDNIAVPLRMKRLSALERAPFLGRLMPGRRRAERVIRDDVERVAEQLEISPLLKRKPGQLSGGQRQRVAVGRAIVRQPRAFLFDEPLSNLDAKLRVHMRAEIAQLHRQLKTTFIYVTHDQAEAMTMSGRIAVMIGGELIQVGTPAAVYDDPHDIRVAEFVGTPKINVFPGRIRSDGRLEMLGHVLHVATPAPEGECRICVRPERIELALHGLLYGTVVHLENLGSEAFVHIGSAGTDAPVVARVNDPSQLPAIGATVGYGFAPEAVRAFDVDGKRIVTSVPSRVERPREKAVV
ncbi:ABC transporter ATP-binding protein [Bradyrhizobium sp. sGM-13]|uniref:ABC transporter ATP-binding protein n=1 Tax=Bradyrhizobium sp. sGM-13 TaxID=2831781 RepID=UPI001BCB3695|nr:ABC transporter ATP-binding protein [Bradyrhizobium sp. sGM-13]